MKCLIVVLIFLLYLAQFSQLTFEKCHSELCCISIFPHYINFFFRDFDKERGGHFENQSEVNITEYDAILEQ